MVSRALLVLAQVPCVLTTSFDFAESFAYGQSFQLGLYQIRADNEEPFSDRSIACVKKGRLYQAVQLSNALLSKQAQVIDTTGATSHGYRVIRRRKLVRSPSSLASWTQMCNLIATTLPNIIQSCTALGYNVTGDRLRVLDGVKNQTTMVIRGSLPVLVLPIGDNTKIVRFAIPSYDGSACVFRLHGAYIMPSESGAWMFSIDRQTREETTAKLLGAQNGVWRNGWLEDPMRGFRWYSDLQNTDVAAVASYGFLSRNFDMRTGRELECYDKKSKCTPFSVEFRWGSDFSAVRRYSPMTAVSIANGMTTGLYEYTASVSRSVRSVFHLSTLTSNFSLLLLLVRWFIAMIVLHRYSFRALTGRAECQPVGIGCLSTARGFKSLPFLLLPRLRSSLAAFFTAGCFLSGDQMPFGEAWFAIYPGIIEVVLFSYAVLNLLAKITHRRMSDVLFGPTLLVLCGLHYFRQEIAAARWFGIDGRVNSAMSTAQYDALKLQDFFVSDVSTAISRPC